MPIMNPSPTEIIELFTFVEVTLVQYATAAAAVKAKPKSRANKVEVAVEEQAREETQACAVTPRPKRNLGANRGATPASPVKTDSKPTEPKRTSKGGKREKGQI